MDKYNNAKYTKNYEFKKQLAVHMLQNLCDVEK
jgi:hypothetical protein